MKSKILKPAVALPLTVLMVLSGVLLLPTSVAYLSAPLAILALILFVYSYVHDLFNPAYPRITKSEEK